jgi:CTP synthase
MMKTKGLGITGTSQKIYVVEVGEIPVRPFFVGVQFQLVFKCRPNRAHPIFREFVRAVLVRSRKIGRMD